MVVFKEITSADKGCFNEAIIIYESSFPANERQPVNTIQERVDRGTENMFVGLMQEDIAMVAFLFNLDNPEFILLDYLAVKNAYQNTGVGSAFLLFIKGYLKGINKHLVIETEHPAYGSNTVQRTARKRFYSNSGALTLNDVVFILPALQGVKPTEMQLMIIPASDFTSLDKSVVQQLIADLYCQVYSMNAVDELVLNVISRLPQIIIVE